MISLLLVSISILSMFSATLVVVQQANAQPITFGNPIDLSNNTGDSRSPKIVSLDSNVYTVWSDNTPGNFDIFFTRSTDGGATFGSPINLSTDSGNSITPQITVEEKNVYVAWVDYTPGNFEVFFARSTDGGNTFSSPINISLNNGFSQDPRIVASGTNVYVVWHKG
jgi:hypothetical protein